jgi:hypothetical protein
MQLEPRNRPAGLAELFDILTGLRVVHYWRGSADASWSLDSTIVRRISGMSHQKRGANEKDVQFWETDLLSRARHKGFDVRGGVRLGDFELLALLRHHGAATRLVDFSRNAAVALWFACSTLPDVEGELLGVSTNQVSGWSEGEQIDGDYQAVTAAVSAADSIWSWEPTGVSSRISAQHSQFLFGKVAPQPYGSMWLPPRDDLVLVDLTPALKVEVTRFLSSVMDIRYLTMFPDVGGFATSFGSGASEDPYRW